MTCLTPADGELACRPQAWALENGNSSESFTAVMRLLTDMIRCIDDWTRCHHVVTRHVDGMKRNIGNITRRPWRLGVVPGKAKHPSDDVMRDIGKMTRESNQLTRDPIERKRDIDDSMRHIDVLKRDIGEMNGASNQLSCYFKVI